MENISFNRSMNVEYRKYNNTLIGYESVEFQTLEISVTNGQNNEFISIEGQPNLNYGDMVIVNPGEANELFFIVDKKKDNHTFYLQFAGYWLLNFSEASNINDPNESSIAHTQDLQPDRSFYNEIRRKCGDFEGKWYDNSLTAQATRKYDAITTNTSHINNDNVNFPVIIENENTNSYSDFSSDFPALAKSINYTDTGVGIDDTSAGVMSIYNIVKSILKSCVQYGFSFDVISNSSGARAQFEIKQNNVYNYDVSSFDTITFQEPELERKVTSLNYETAVSVQYNNVDDENDAFNQLSALYEPVLLNFYKRKDGSIGVSEKWDAYIEDKELNGVFPQRHARVQKMLNYNVTQVDGGE